MDSAEDTREFGFRSESLRSRPGWRRRPHGCGTRRQGLARVKPVRQKAASIKLLSFNEGDPVVAEKRLQATIVEGVKGLGAAANMGAVHEDLRDGGRGYPRAQGVADLTSPVVLLMLGRIQVDRAIGNARSLEEAAH